MCGTPALLSPTVWGTFIEVALGRLPSEVMGAAMSSLLDFDFVVLALIDSCQLCGVVDLRRVRTDVLVGELSQQD